MASQAEIQSAAEASSMPAAQLSATEAELKEKYGDDVPPAVQAAIGEAVKSLKVAMAQATPTPDTGSLSFPIQNSKAAGFPLPPELRNRIYDLCIEPLDENIAIHWRHPVRFSPLTQVCREMRYDTLSYYHHCWSIRLCSCMRRPERISLFLQGPGETIVPFARYFSIEGANSEVSISLPGSGERAWHSDVYITDCRDCGQEETEEETMSREEAKSLFSHDMELFLEDAVRKRENGEYFIQVDTFKQVCDMFREWDEEHFGD